MGTANVKGECSSQGSRSWLELGLMGRQDSATGQARALAGIFQAWVPQFPRAFFPDLEASGNSLRVARDLGHRKGSLEPRTPPTPHLTPSSKPRVSDSNKYHKQPPAGVGVVSEGGK